MDDTQNISKACRICFVTDDTVVNRINTIHEKAIQMIVQKVDFTNISIRIESKAGQF